MVVNYKLMISEDSNEFKAIIIRLRNKLKVIKISEVRIIAKEI